MTREKTTAVILAAGMGSRLGALAQGLPKSLLDVGGQSILARMIDHIMACGIEDAVFILGHMEQHIRDFVRGSFPALAARFIVNEDYAGTNTGFSLMLAEGMTGGGAFVKFDADVVFERDILARLLASPHENVLCIDRNIRLELEEVKVVLEGDRVTAVGKEVDPAIAAGESIGIEKIGTNTAPRLFAELHRAMRSPGGLGEYYEASYQRLAAQGVPFHALDISGLKWVEIDTPEDAAAAREMFA